MKSLLLKYSRVASIVVALLVVAGVVFAGYKGYTDAAEDHLKVASIEAQVNDIHTYIVSQAVRDSSLKYSFGELKGEVGNLKNAVVKHLAITGEIILSQQFPDKGYKVDPNKLIEFIPAAVAPEIKKNK